MELVNQDGRPLAAQPVPHGAQQQGAITPLDMINAAVQRGASVEQITQLIALKERIEADEARKAFVIAMTAFKQNPPTIVKNKMASVTAREGGRSYNYGYADLAAVCGAVDEALAKVGIGHCWTTQQGNGAVTVTCTLTHALGHRESTSLSSGVDQSGGKNPIQAIGSAVKYLERYTLLAITGLAVQDGEDDDGAGAGLGEDRDPNSTRAPRAGKPNLPDAKLLAAAGVAADKGGNHFRDYWKALDKASRDQLRASLPGLEARANKADAGRS
jgi:hypothetical protein